MPLILLDIGFRLGEWCGDHIPDWIMLPIVIIVLSFICIGIPILAFLGY